jgi:amino acid transporter
MKWRYWLHWIVWALLSTVLFISDYFFYERKVQTGTDDGNLFFLVVCSHLVVCMVAYKNAIVDLGSKRDKSIRNLILMFFIVALFFSHTFDLFAQSKRLAVMAVVIVAMIIFKIKDKKGKIWG